MTTRLDPIVSEFETQEQADAYDHWLCAKVQASLAEPGLGVPHDEAMAMMDAIIEDAERRQRGRA
ncbi:type II toxin-antitoxin system RelB family antitoxin [Halomonas sp. E14]|uniref:type II toxin-antitoxin system RelB family antitoxin n=1 Tax=Halomonas sp. E14 TaxID=3397245 RepID=UPI00403E841F